MLKLNSPELLFDKRKIFKSVLPMGQSLPDSKGNDDFKVVVLYEMSSPEMSAGQREMLGKMISACKYDIDKTLFINLKFAPFSTDKLSSAEMVLVFGNLMISRNMTELRKHIPVKLSGVYYLRAEALEKLEADPAEKKKLWGVLKNMLGL